MDPQETLQQSEAAYAGFFLFFAGFGIILFYSIGNSIIQPQSPDHLWERAMGGFFCILGALAVYWLFKR
jgi:hypothetical protein